MTGSGGAGGNAGAVGGSGGNGGAVGGSGGHQAAVGAGGVGGGAAGAGGRGGGAGSYDDGCNSRLPPVCLTGGGGGICDDIGPQPICPMGKVWGCPSGSVPRTECRCILPQPGACSCGDNGWVCPDGGVGGTGGAAGSGGASPNPDAGAGGSGGSACASLTTLAACDARTDCHARFFDPQTCGCAAIGCCAHFSGCADGAKAVCAQPPTLGCEIVTPHCEGPYVIAYTPTCYEGCVRASQCF